MSTILKYWGIQFKAQLQYKLSFVLSFLAQFVLFLTFYISIYAMFEKFGNLKEFNFYEVLLCFSIIHIAYYLVEMFARGFDKFEEYVVTGELDRFLVRPINIYKQILGSQVAFQKIGRIIQAIGIFVYSLIKLNLPFTFMNILTLSLMIIGATSIFVGIFILGAAFCFVTIEGLEARNVFTNGGKYTSQYPMGIYKKKFLQFFTFIVPFACVNYYPLLYVLGRTDNIIYALLPIVGIIFVIPCVLVFNKSMKKYCSTGS